MREQTGHSLSIIGHNSHDSGISVGLLNTLSLEWDR